MFTLRTGENVFVLCLKVVGLLVLEVLAAFVYVVEIIVGRAYLAYERARQWLSKS